MLIISMLLIPLIGAIAILLLKKSSQISKYIALTASLLNFALGIKACLAYQLSMDGYQLAINQSWIPSFGVSLSFGLDGLSLPLFVLTTLLVLLVIIFSWDVNYRAPLYFSLLLILETGVLGVFSSLDFFLFYIFWEIVLIPMFFIIGIWGGPRKDYAAMKFLIYTHVASLIMLLGIGAMFFEAYKILGYYTFSIPELTQLSFPVEFQILVFPALLFAFLVKLPAVPFHTWLPDAHVEAPTGGSVLLAGILLKMGGYGLIRVAYMINPQGAEYYTWIVVIIALLSIVYGGYVALAQDDMKKMIAYSSISHMGFVLIGIASMTELGIQGAIFQMVGHGLITGILFMGCGAIQHSAGTRSISQLGGLYYKMPKGLTILVLAFFASMGLPGFVGFIGELTVLMGVYQSFGYLAFLIALGMVIGVVYYLWTFQRIAFGKVKENLLHIHDIKFFELLPMVILLLLTIYFGIQPNWLLDIMAQPVEQLLALLT